MTTTSRAVCLNRTSTVDLTNDEFTCLLLANEGQSMIPIGRWKEPILALTGKGLMVAHDSVNYGITPAGKAACVDRERDDDQALRGFLESGNKIANARTQAQQSVEQAALHLSFAARASVQVTGDRLEDAIASWIDIVKVRALEIAKGG